MRIGIKDKSRGPLFRSSIINPKNRPLVLALFLLLLLAGCSVESAKDGLPPGDNASPISANSQSREETSSLSPEPSPEAMKESQADSLPPEIGLGGDKHSSPPAENEPLVLKAQVRLLVTRDDGKEVIFDQEVDLLEDASVMDILKVHLEVESSYGGGFVTGINGLKSVRAGPGREAQDWFYYINGNSANIGAASCHPVAGDEICWDYHSWGAEGR